MGAAWAGKEVRLRRVPPRRERRREGVFIG
jgi:hypothetical protein